VRCLFCSFPASVLSSSWPNRDVNWDRSRAVPLFYFYDRARRPTSAKSETRNALSGVCDLHSQGCEPCVMFVKYAHTVQIFHGFNGTAPSFQDRRRPGRTRRGRVHKGTRARTMREGNNATHPWRKDEMTSDAPQLAAQMEKMTTSAPPAESRRGWPGRLWRAVKRYPIPLGAVALT
jgi:hypothetical protein